MLFYSCVNTVFVPEIQYILEFSQINNICFELQKIHEKVQPTTGCFIHIIV